MVACAKVTLLCIATGIVGCSTDAPTPGATAERTQAEVAPSPTAITSTSASATPPPVVSPLAGKWRGSFEAKKAPVTLDPGVTEPAWTGDDGAAASGNGTAEVEVSPEGVVTGRLRGALGEAKITGMVDETRMTAMFGPASPDADPAMAGTIVLDKDGPNELGGTLRASSGDARLVRSAALKLRRE